LIPIEPRASSSLAAYFGDGEKSVKDPTRLSLMDRNKTLASCHTKNIDLWSKMCIADSEKFAEEQRIKKMKI
jgi:hypothetical protein